MKIEISNTITEDQLVVFNDAIKYEMNGNEHKIFLPRGRCVQSYRDLVRVFRVDGADKMGEVRAV